MKCMPSSSRCVDELAKLAVATRRLETVIADQRAAPRREALEAVLGCSRRTEVDLTVAVEIAPAVEAEKRLVAIGFDIAERVRTQQPDRLGPQANLE